MKSWSSVLATLALSLALVPGCGFSDEGAANAESVVVEELRTAAKKSAEAPQPEETVPPPPVEIAPLDCDNVMAVAWPPSAPAPSPTGWVGPTCQEGATTVSVTWVLDAEGAELTDVMFVKIMAAFKAAGWAVTEPTAGPDAALRAEAVNGSRKAMLRYSTISDGDKSTSATADAAVTVSFDR